MDEAMIDKVTAHKIMVDKIMADKVSFIAAIRGPVMLIALGVLLAMDYQAGIRFGKTWPILLIVAGVLHLFGRRGAARP